MDSKTTSIILTWMVIASFIIIIVEIAQEVGCSQTIYVDDSNTTPPWLGTPGDPYQYIQDGVDAAQPGDTVSVSVGTYYEDVTITETINLTGEDRDSTIINCTTIGVWALNIDSVNVSGFTVENASSSGSGIAFTNSNNSLVYDCRVEENGYGITISNCNNTVVTNNIASNSSGNYHGITIDESTNITVKNNICNGNGGKGIYIYGTSHNNQIIDNVCSYNEDGIALFSFSKDNYLFGNDFSSNIRYGIWDSSEGGNIYRNITIKDCDTGMRVGTSTQDVQIFNSTIENSSVNDINVVGSSTYFTLINTTFNKTKSYFGGSSSNLLIVKWYLHINVIDFLGNPVSNVKVNIEDNMNSTYNQTFMTDVNGNLRWLTITEYIEQDTDGNNIGEKIYHTPHKITAWNDTLVGYANPEPFINESITITIVLFNGTLLDLEKGWNLISLPRIQADTNLQNVLKSIEGRYGAVRWYNSTDLNDHWKHIKIGKPFGNDLNNLNHKMGFWIYIIDPEGTTLLVHGNKFSAQQTIDLKKGWNHVGFPSNSNKTRIAGLNNLNFGDDVNKIVTYNATLKTWVFLDTDNHYFEIGKGYWMHLKVEKTWNVPI